jgi:hypothetical protein
MIYPVKLYWKKFIYEIRHDNNKMKKKRRKKMCRFAEIGFWESLDVRKVGFSFISWLIDC